MNPSGRATADAWRALGHQAIVALADGGNNDELDLARARFLAELAEPSPFSTVVANARLDAPAAMLLAVAVSCELDIALARAVSRINDDLARPRLTLQTVDRLMQPVGSSVADVLGHGAALRRSEFVEVVEDGPWAAHTVVVRPAVIWALVGDTATDPDLPAGTTVADAIDTVTPDGRATTRHELVVVSGDDRIARRRAALAHAGASRFLVSNQPGDANGWRALVREATLSGAGIIVELADNLPPDARHVITKAHHLAWAISARKELSIAELPDRPWMEVAATSVEPTTDEWLAAIGTTESDRHHLSAEQLDNVSRVYDAVGRDLDSAVRRLMAGPLEQLAQRIRPTRTWDDIVLSADRTEQLHDIVERYRYASKVFDEWGFSAKPSRGLVALFAGASGTGKTLAAEIVAGELGLDVFKLNLSSVVSKYIGETEKNLEQIFDAAGSGNVVLFFDEADSLFGKRSEVKDARDRYANIEVSYLLQRLERYDGVVLLATNFEKNVDDAFLRRIHVRVEFPVPGTDERALIWQRNVPPTAPLGDIDLGFLAERFEIPGGAIRNAAVHAAFLAAANDSAIDMRHAVTAVAREYRKLGRLLKPEQFGPYFALINDGASAQTGTADGRRV